MKRLIIKIAIIAIMAVAFMLAMHKIRNLKKENARLKSNQEVLLIENKTAMAENQKYKVSDSLNAIRVSQLEFTLKEYKKYRADDLKLIKQLKAKKSDLQNVVTSQLETISTLSAKLSDSIEVNKADNIIDTIKCFDYKSKWTDVKGHISLKNNSITLQIKNRESLKIVETVTRKRFLGFLWKTRKVKSRQVDVVSENPNTEIVNCEYVSIER